MISVQKSQGSVTLLSLIAIFFLTLLATGLAGQIQIEMNHLVLSEQEEMAHYAAEAGINIGLAEIMIHSQNFQQTVVENLDDSGQCYAVVKIDKPSSVYYITSDGIFHGMHQKLIATVENYPGPQAKVLIRNSVANSND